ncbi:MAG: hypothetical protein HY682_04305 [Chloroflexi bacterium]|nr:hypothetical protein [Chloroflexota bacterium]
MVTEILSKRRPPEHLLRLVDRVVEAAADPVYARRKDMWTRHNRLEKVDKTPVFVCLKRGSGRAANPVAWSEVLSPESRVATDPLEREVELQLLQKLFKHDQVPDDDVLLPTLWLRAIPPRVNSLGSASIVRPTGPSVDSDGQESAGLWGLPFKTRTTADPGGAYAVEPVVSTEADVEKLHRPRYAIDESATRSLQARAQELVDGRVPVKIKTDEVGFSPTEVMISLMGMEAVLYAVIERPEFVHRLMDLITQGMIAYHLEREAAGAVDPEETWGYRVQYEKLPAATRTNRLAYCWPTVAAQSMCGISPAMYDEFVQPYHARLAAIVGEHRVYYHGCENLTAKIPIIRHLPNLRRFHMSAWTDLEVAVGQLGRDFVLEIANHPETLAVQSATQMRKDVERIMEVAGDCIIDINLGEIETVFGNPSVLSTWARVAQEVVAEYA